MPITTPGDDNSTITVHKETDFISALPMDFEAEGSNEGSQTEAKLVSLYGNNSEL